MRARDAQKNGLKPHLKDYWVIPPDHDADFVCAMEDVLEVYHRDYDPKRPVVFLDETSKQLVAETRAPIPAEARRLAERLEIHYTPKHGSWLNIAEIELGLLNRQCLDRRIGTIEEVKEQVRAWQRQPNSACGTLDWQCTTADARIKLKRHYPSIKV